MATLNPLEQKARSSFIKGLVIGLLIAIVIGGLLGYQLNNVNKELKRVNSTIKEVYALNRYVKSGWILTEDMFTKVKTVTAPVDALTSWNAITTRTLQDENGRIIKICTNEFYVGGKYDNGVLKDHKKVSFSNDSKVVVSYNDKEIPLYYMENENGEVIAQLTVDPSATPDDMGRLPMYYVTLSGEGGALTATLETSRTIKVLYADVIAKVDMTQNTILTPGLITSASEKITNDMREVEYAMVLLPSNLEDKDVIDIRLRLADGTDYVVLPKKTVSLIASSGTYNSKSIRLKLNEYERLIMNCAIIDKYQIGAAAKLYALRYSDAGIQESSSVTYVPSFTILDFVKNNPNQVEEAKEKLYEDLKKFDYTESRKKIEDYLGAVEEDERKTNIESGTTSETSAQQALRDSFVSSLTVSKDGLQ